MYQERSACPCTIAATSARGCGVDATVSERTRPG